MKHLLLTIAILAAAPSYAGGPVITEDTTETVAPKRNNALLFIVVGALFLTALASQNGDCFAEEPEQPGGGC